MEGRTVHCPTDDVPREFSGNFINIQVLGNYIGLKMATVKCKSCGMEFTAPTEEEAKKLLMAHAGKEHK